ncbi:MAG TPA: hypothetical protein VKB50_00120 [Vicinamibacterales bacterium]|nr:hypothetical protein [Vicinamibacterales bacterium]
MTRILAIEPIPETPEPEPRGLFSLLRWRRSTPLVPSYGISPIDTRIDGAITQATIARAVAAVEEPGMVVPSPAQQPIEALQTATPLCQDVFTMRERAKRWEGWQLPWFSEINVPSGVNLRLINISSSGLLVESCSRLPSGETTTFRLWGPSRDVTMPARIVRSEVASADRVGVMYQAAAVFDSAFDALMPASTEPIDVDTHLAGLVDLVHEKAARGVDPQALRAEFEAGVMTLVGQSEVRLRDVPVADNDGRESVYFTIAGDKSAVLQVTFAPDYQPRLVEFDALKAAAVAASRIVRLTDTARHVS